MSSIDAITAQDLEKVEEEVFEKLYLLVIDEYYRRRRRDEEKIKLAALQADYLKDRDGAQPAEDDDPRGKLPVFKQPESSLERYPKGWMVEADGVMWRSTVDDNSAAPGEGDTWERFEFVTAETDWRPDHDYEEGETLTWRGKQYAIRVKHRSTPGQTPEKRPDLYELPTL